MKSKILKILAGLTYYPRLLLDSLLFFFIKNDYSLLDKFKSQDCLIVGNGPSLNKTDLQSINMPSIGMNKVNLLFSRSKWRPDLIVCVNGLVIRQNVDFFNSTEITLVLPVKALYLGIKKRSNIIFVKISDSLNFQDDIKKPLGIGSTVTYTCFQIAAFAKVKSVNIVGVDHNFTLDPDKKNKEHNIELLKSDDVNHFDPNYFKGNFWGLPDLKASEEAYVVARDYFLNKKIQIIDYTINGKLKTFTKGVISNLYKK